MGYKNVRVIFTTPEHASQLIDENGKPKAGTAYINKKTGEKTIFINENAEENQTKTGLIGVIAEEGSHIINGAKGRQIETGTEEKGLESTGRATNEYFQEKYKDDTDKLITHKSDGIDYSGIDFGENVGDVAGVDDAAVITIIFIAGTGYVVYRGSKAIMTYATSYEAQKRAREIASATGATVDTVIRKGREVGKWVWNGLTWVVEQSGRIFGNGSSKNNRKSNPDQVKSAQEKYEEAKKEFDDLSKKPNKSKKDKEKLKVLGRRKDHWRKKALEESELHAKQPQGNKNQNGGNSRGRGR